MPSWRDSTFANVDFIKAETHSASGDPEFRSGCTVFLNCPRVTTCKCVMSNGNMVTLSCLDSLSGYGSKNAGGGWSECLDAGGIVEFGRGEVKAYTRAAAKLSA